MAKADLPVVEGEEIDYEKLDRALVELKSMDDRRYRVVILRYFAGLSEQQIADQLQVTTRTVQRDWKTARVFLLALMQEEPRTK